MKTAASPIGAERDNKPVNQHHDPQPAPESVSGFRDLVGIAGRSTYLLLALLALLILYPYAPADSDRLLFGFINSAILITAVHAVSAARRHVATALVLAIPTLTLQWLHLGGSGAATGLMFGVSVSVFYLYTIAHVLAYVLGAGPVTADKLHAAVSTYILIALLWMVFYGIVEGLVPGSFMIGEHAEAGEPPNWRDLLFFSFTTLTSTGYGHIIPASRYAQSFAILEQLSGIFFVAILIARLAGLYQPSSSRRRGGPPP